MESQFNLKQFLVENKLTSNSKIPQMKSEERGTLHVSMGDNAEEEQKVIDIAKDAIALMDEQPGTDAVSALESVIEHFSEVNEYSDYEPGSIAPADLYYSDKHGKLVAMDDVDDKYHDSLEGWLVVKKGDKVPHPED